MTGSLDSSGGDLERDVLRLMLGTNAALLVDRLGQGPPGDQGSVIAALAAATSLGSVLDDVVVSLVRQATWKDALGRPSDMPSRSAARPPSSVSRLARGKRRRSREGPPDASRLALRSLRQFLDGEFDALRADFNERMAEACPVSLLASVRSSLARELGRVLELGNPRVTPGAGYTVVDIPITYKKGRRKGRVALDPDARIAGFFVLSEGVR